MFDRLNFLGGKMFARYAPDLAKQALLSIFRKRNVTPALASEWVEQDLQLWGLVKENQREMLRNLVRSGADIDWLTCDWLIDAIKPEYPDVATLFEAWDEGREWVEHQIVDIRSRVS